MKRFIAVAASAVLALGAFTFAACSPVDGEISEQPDGFKDYADVDMSSEEQKQEFVQEISQKLDVNKMFGNISAEDWAFGLSGKFKISSEANVTLTVSEENMTSQIGIEGNISSEQSMKARFSANKAENLMPEIPGLDISLPVSVAAEASSSLKGNFVIPNRLYNEILPADMLFIKDLLTDFDYSISQYIDNDNIYMQLPVAAIEKLPDGMKGVLPENGKVKASLGSLLSGMGGIVPFAYAELPSSPFDGTDADILSLLDKYSIKISVSKDAGYSLKISAGSEAVAAVLADESLGIPEEVVAMINSGVQFNACSVTAYLAVDENGLFKQANLSINIDLNADISGIPAELTAVKGGFKLSVEMGFAKYDGQVTLPADADTYTDILSLGLFG